MLLKTFSCKAHRPITGLPKGPKTMQKELKEATTAFFLKIVATENDD